MRLTEYADRDMLAMGLADRLAGDLENALFTHETVSLAVPGGTSPGPVFDVLSATSIDWKRVAVLPTDERCVPPDHERSNARLIRERLLTGRAAPARPVPLWSAGTGDTSDEELAGCLPRSVLLVGMGADMHTASMFPAADRLKAALAEDAPAAMELTAPGAPEPRVTLTAHVLDGAMSKHMIIFGQDKRDALDRALSLHPEEAPVAAILTDMNVHWAE